MFWLTGVASWVNIAIPIDIDRPDAAIMADIHRYWDQVSHVQVGEKPDARTAAIIRDLVSGKASTPA